ncbi:hypothetical protein ACH4UM_12905 [Streptomyces sp. NPDC020801]
MTTATNQYYMIRAIATRHKVATAVIAGLVATHIATMWGYWFHALKLPVLDWNTTNGQQLLPDASHNVQFAVGALAHYSTGVCFALLFAFGPHAFLTWRNTALGNLAKALAFSVLLAILSALVMVPLVFYPQFHPGFFSHRLGFNGVLAIFVWHVIYGLHLGAIYTPLPDDEVIQDGIRMQKADVAPLNTTDAAPGVVQPQAAGSSAAGSAAL